MDLPPYINLNGDGCLNFIKFTQDQRKKMIMRLYL